MPTAVDPFADWLAQAGLSAHRLTAEQVTLLQACCRFRQSRGDDYYSTRLLTHFLLHCGSGLKLAQLARLLGINRVTASRQQDTSSRQAIQQAHHRMDGRPYGKLLPSYAGPIAGFLFQQPNASRADLIDFIDRTFGVRVSRIAVYHFLKKYGLDQPPQPTTRVVEAVADARPVVAPLEVPPQVPRLTASQPVPEPVPPFSARRPPTREPSSSCPRPARG